ncbi:unnamed protein product [Linum tenue]|uniref:Uncharacterized protein n=1 Tax=Linum tenue TaxID=586396 RepID=A0AAV0HBM9_9ROSI|nr:unnamed protein product [Linum tenue]
MKIKKGASRFARQMKPQQSASGGDSLAPEKSKKGRIRRLSAVNRASSSSFEDSPPSSLIMGKRNNNGDVCDRDEQQQQQLPSSSSSPVSGNYVHSKGFKLPRKLLDGCNGVVHATVPRKLRSAMKKRSRESMSPPLPGSQKLNPGTAGDEEARRGNGFKRSRLGLQKQQSGPITKDEEEVAEALYALAGMFPDNTLTDNDAKLENNPPDENAAALKDGREVPGSAIKEDLNSILSSRGKIQEETADISSWKISRVQDLPEIYNGRSLAEKIVNLVGQVNMNTTSLVDKLEKEKKFVCNSTDALIPLEPVLDTEYADDRLHLSGVLLRYPLLFSEFAVHNMMLFNLQKEKWANQARTLVTWQNDRGFLGAALDLWPGLSSAASSGASSSQNPSLQCSPAKLPAWLDAAVSTSRLAASPSKVSDRRPWRRSMIHVCISHLIQTLQTSESKDKHPPAISTETLKPGLSMTLNDFHDIRKGFTEVAATGTNESAREGIVLHQRRMGSCQSQPTVLPLGTYSSQKQQSFNFMSFLQANTSFNGATTHQTQLHPTTTYLGRPLYAPPNLTTQQLLQHHQQQQQAQVQQSLLVAAAQYRAARASPGAAPTMTHLSTWQNRKHDTAPPAGAAMAMPAYVRAIIAPQDHQLHARARRQGDAFSSGYEQGVGRGGFRANGAAAATATATALPLQLLCDERL